MIVKNNSKELETDYAYIVNGKSVDKETFDDYVSKFTSNSVDEDTDEAEKMIRDMRKNFQREVSGMFDMCYT